MYIQYVYTNENIYIAPGLSASYEDIEVETDASSRIKKMDGTYYNVNFDYGIIVDKRNQPFQPTSGYRTKFAQSLPIIIDSSSIANTFEYSHYKGLTEDVIADVIQQHLDGLDQQMFYAIMSLAIPDDSYNVWYDDISEWAFASLEGLLMEYSPRL